MAFNDLEKVLDAVKDRFNLNYAARDITSASGQNRTFVYRVLTNLITMQLVARRRKAWQFKVFENTSTLDNMSLESLIELYEAWSVTRRRQSVVKKEV